MFLPVFVILFHKDRGQCKDGGMVWYTLLYDIFWNALLVTTLSILTPLPILGLGSDGQTGPLLGSWTFI